MGPLEYHRMELDRFDAELLSLIQQDNRLTARDIGERIGLSGTACQRRLNRLREAGVIEKEVAIVAPKLAGRPISMLVLVTLERERADIIDRFKESIKATPEVMQGHYVTGDADFVLVVTAKSMEDYEDFTRRFFYDNANIKSFRTLVVMDRVKAGFAIPIEVNAGL
jgi:Lrp/AsnC family transcriptional regulator, leucine-responsive regulatory protein